MIGYEAKTAPLVPARAMQGAIDVNRPLGVVYEDLIWSEHMVSALVTASRQETGHTSAYTPVWLKPGKSQ